MFDFMSYLFYKAKARYYLAKANAMMKYHESLPYRRIALNYEMRAYALKHRMKKR